MKNQLSARIYKIKPGKKDQWELWCTQLQYRLQDEARETLKEENVLRECFMVFAIDGNDYTIGITDDFGNILPSNKEKEINRKHREQMNDCLESSALAKTLYDISVDELST